MATPHALRQAGRGRPLRGPRGGVSMFERKEHGRAPPPRGRGQALGQRTKEMDDGRIGGRTMGRGRAIQGERSELAEFVLRGGRMRSQSRSRSKHGSHVNPGGNRRKNEDWFSSTERLQALERLGEVEEEFVGVKEAGGPFAWGDLQGGVGKLEEGHWAKGWLGEVVRGVEGNRSVEAAEKEKFVGECFKMLRNVSLAEPKENADEEK